MNKTNIAFALAATLIGASGALAQQTPDPDAPFVNPCSQSPATDFDFWVGDWVAFDYETGVVQGIDRIERINNGCTLWQHWSQLTDRYRGPNADFRYGGVSLSSTLRDGRWQQVWVGNWGGTITLTGELDENGRMVLTTEPQTTQNGDIGVQRWYWEQTENGELHSWGDWRTRQEDGTWTEPQIFWNLRYVPRSSSPELVAAPPAEDEAG